MERKSRRGRVTAAAAVMVAAGRKVACCRCAGCEVQPSVICSCPSARGWETTRNLRSRGRKKGVRFWEMQIGGLGLATLGACIEDQYVQIPGSKQKNGRATGFPLLRPWTQGLGLATWEACTAG